MDSDYRINAKPSPEPEKRLPFWERFFPKKAPTEAELVKQEREKAIQALETRAHYLFRILEHHPNLVEYTPVKSTHLYGLHLGYSVIRMGSVKTKQEFYKGEMRQFKQKKG